MRITVIAIGRLKEKYLKQGIEEYSKRLSRFCDLEIIEVEDEQAPENLSAAQELQLKRKEAERVEKRIRPGALLILLDVAGEKPDSVALAQKFNSFFLSGSSHLVFVIGGSLGLDADLIRKADYRLSLSNLTFPHQLARLVLLEQIFRAFKILNGEVYHK